MTFPQRATALSARVASGTRSGWVRLCRMFLAQAIGEYGGVAGVISGAFTRAYNGVQSFLYDAEPSTWMIVAAVVVVVWLMRPK